MNFTVNEPFLVENFFQICKFRWNKLFLFLGTGIWSPPDPEELYSQFYTKSAGYWMYMDPVLYMACGLYVYLNIIWVQLLLGEAKKSKILKFSIDFHAESSWPFAWTAISPWRTRWSTIPAQRKIGVVATVGLIFLCSAVTSLYAPIAYHWQLSNSAMAVGSQYQEPPESLLTWRKYDAWFEVTNDLHQLVKKTQTISTISTISTMATMEKRKMKNQKNF